MSEVLSQTKAIEIIQCCDAKTNALLHIFIFAKRHKWCINGVHIDYKEYVKISLIHPLKCVLKRVCAPPLPASTSCPNELRSLINRILIIDSF